MAWVRMDTGMKRDPRLWQLATALRKDVGATVGYVMNVLAELPEHARDGDLSNVPDEVLESWAMWPGKRGAFAAAFVAQLCDGRQVRAWEKHNGAALREADRSRERVRAFRERQRTEQDARRNGAPPANQSATDTSGNAFRNGDGNAFRNAERNRERYGTERNGVTTTTAAGAADTHTAGSAEPAVEPPGFAVAWAAYPTRAGGNPRTRAAKAYRARLAEGATPADMLAGVERYAAYCEATEKAGTEFVMQGATFFGPDRRWTEQYEAPDEYANDPAALAAIAARDKADADAIWIAERAAARANGVQTQATPVGVAR